MWLFTVYEKIPLKHEENKSCYKKNLLCIQKKINIDYDDNTWYLREKAKQNKKPIKVVFHNSSTYEYCFITRASKRI